MSVWVGSHDLLTDREVGATQRSFPGELRSSGRRLLLLLKSSRRQLQSSALNWINPTSGSVWIEFSSGLFNQKQLKFSLDHDRDHERARSSAIGRSLSARNLSRSEFQTVSSPNVPMSQSLFRVPKCLRPTLMSVTVVAGMMV